MPRTTLEGRREYNNSKRDRQKVWVKEYRLRNPEKVKLWKRSQQHNDTVRKQTRRIKRNEGIAGEPYGTVCAICSKECKTVFDHCHRTGKFRGWLCAHCNRTLGFIEAYPDVIDKMFRYLELHRSTEWLSK